MGYLDNVRVVDQLIDKEKKKKEEKVSNRAEIQNKALPIYPDYPTA